MLVMTQDRLSQIVNEPKLSVHHKWRLILWISGVYKNLIVNVPCVHALGISLLNKQNQEITRSATDPLPLCGCGLGTRLTNLPISNYIVLA